MSGWRDEIARFLTAEGKEKIRMLFDEPDEGVQVPEDEDMTGDEPDLTAPTLQEIRDAASGDLSGLPQWERDLLSGQLASPEPRSASQRRRLAFAGIGASLPARTCCSTPAGTSHQGTCPNSVMCCGEYRPHVNELPPPRREPRRDDDVDRWLKRTRDSLLALGSGRDTVLAAQAVDDLLNDYRLHADTGTPLDAEVSER